MPGSWTWPPRTLRVRAGTLLALLLVVETLLMLALLLDRRFVWTHDGITTSSSSTTS